MNNSKKNNFIKQFHVLIDNGEAVSRAIQGMFFSCNVFIALLALAAAVYHFMFYYNTVVFNDCHMVCMDYYVPMVLEIIAVIMFVWCFVKCWTTNPGRVPVYWGFQ